MADDTIPMVLSGGAVTLTRGGMTVTNPHRRKIPPPPNCASGTTHNDGAKIHAAIKAQQRADLLNHRAKQRSPKEWWDLYIKAMAEKRATQVK
jgi:hypothetical protein